MHPHKPLLLWPLSVACLSETSNGNRDSLTSEQDVTDAIGKLPTPAVAAVTRLEAKHPLAPTENIPILPKAFASTLTEPTGTPNRDQASGEITRASLTINGDPVTVGSHTLKACHDDQHSAIIQLPDQNFSLPIRHGQDAEATFVVAGEVFSVRKDNDQVLIVQGPNRQGFPTFDSTGAGTTAIRSLDGTSFSFKNLQERQQSSLFTGHGPVQNGGFNGGSPQKNSASVCMPSIWRGTQWAGVLLSWFMI